MSAKTEPKTVKMIFDTGDDAITVSVAEEKVDRLGPQFSMPEPARKSTKSD
jgi:hypothetical protein